jgi:hypothetical protein
MALFDKGPVGNTLTGLAIGLGVVVLAPVVLPALRPVAKAAIKGGLYLYGKGKENLAEVGESFEDMVAEAKSELKETETEKSSDIIAAEEGASTE